MAQQFPPQMLASALSPGKGFGAPPLAPDVLAQQQRVQQQAMLAQQLLNQEPLQGQMVSGHYVAPNPLQGLARALQTYAGYRTMADLPQEQQKLQEAQQQALARQFGLAMGGQQAEAAPGAPMQEGQPSFPLLPGRSAQESYMIASQIGLPDYLKLAAQQSAPTDTQRDLMAAGLRAGSTEYQQALYNVTNRPTNVAPGGTLFDPVTRQPIFSAPQNGIQMTQGPNGPIATPVPGYAQTQADIAGAQTRAEEQARADFDLVTVPDGRGGTIQMPRSQAVESLSPAPASVQPQEPAPSVSGRPAPQLGATEPAAVVEARKNLPDMEASSRLLIDNIDALLNHPGLEGSVGAQIGMSIIPGTDEADFVTRLDQLRGGTFLDAYERLRGGGAITEIEGKRAEQARARLSRAQSEAAFKEALQEYRGIIITGINRARQKAGLDPLPAQAFAKKQGPTSGGEKRQRTKDYSSNWGG